MRRTGLSHVYFVSGGSEAIEASLKMARQYFVEKGEPQRTQRHRPPPELSRQHARRARHRRQRDAPHASSRPLLIETHHVDPCFAYRFKEQGESDEDYAARAAQVA